METSVATVMLMLSILTPGQLPDKRIMVPQPSLEACWDEADRFLREQKVPEDMKGLAAGCMINHNYEQPVGLRRWRGK